ncbi:MAG: DUF5317 domain-containing protein [Coriobacteriia bacterium]|nr:DUF5317 domain-containing protein [Coriobacteriia bacterium]MBN2823632.1 DUF5317 domain-containing protein [Coriobacteriia bacterium]
MILLDGILAGILGGLVLGGNFANLRRLKVRGETTLGIALLVQLMLPWLSRTLPGPHGLYLGVWLLMMGLLVVVALANRKAVGMILVAVGVILNMVVICANGAMPVNLEAIAVVDPDVDVSRLEFDMLHEPLTQDTSMSVLADQWGIGGPGWHRGVVSVGDIFLVLGTGVIVFCGMRATC